jgi:hypothetical protein
MLRLLQVLLEVNLSVAATPPDAAQLPRLGPCGVNVLVQG